MRKSMKKAILPIASISLASVLLFNVSELPVHAETKKHSVMQVEKNALPLGTPNLKEYRTAVKLAPGVTHTKITRGKQSDKDFFTVDVDFVDTYKQAKTLAKKLKNDGYNEIRIDRVTERAMDDKEKGPLGFLVRVGVFQLEADAVALQQKLSDNGYTGLRVVFTGEDGQRTTGPWVINVIEVDPDKFKGKIVPKLANDTVQGKETLTKMAERNHALAGINGGYFVVGSNDGTPGDLAGISVVNGKLISEAVNGRSSLLLPSSKTNAAIASFSSSIIAVSSNGAVREVDGVNRKPGLIRGCGGTGGDTITEEPKHDYTCKDDSELIQFTRAFGEKTEVGDGVEVVLNESGDVIELRNNRGGEIPSKGSVLAGTKEAAQWLSDHAQEGMNIQVKSKIKADGKPLKLEQTSGIINGGPRLIENRKLAINAVEEGFHWEENPEFYYRFGERRNPRTLAGVKENGNLLFVTIDGRAPGWSVGANFEESARIMKSLGAVDALNLDGGGSTAMTANDTLVTRPSDQTDERPIADAILLLQ
ncbi:phosphodiester glycosidase family protein [Metabacillus arenae]|uniref:Phosphodiester glycosidase family protein n=1 Tax=Metabacillus arenae TaxID=2771434 RepID=A0A926NPS1_9BACI|nr:phosphodiester glycosidase family protein [Metabacillus arenae]MBD1381822.1 phosphodiester glycosidase family protein [Metabacillus arenae]